MITATSNFWQYPKQHKVRGRPRFYTLTYDPGGEFIPGLAFYEDELKFTLRWQHFRQGTKISSRDGKNYVVKNTNRGQVMIEIQENEL